MQQVTTSLYPLLSSSMFLCPTGNLALQACSSPNCMQKQSFFCNNQSCKCKNKTSHQNCSFVSVQQLIGKVEIERIAITQNHQVNIDSILEIYDQIIEEISISKIQFEDSINYFGLGPNTQQLIKFMQDNKRQNITGNLINSTIHQHGWAKQLTPPYQILIQKLRKQIENKVKDLIQQLNKLYLGKQDEQNEDVEQFITFAKAQHKPIRDEGGRPLCSIQKWLKEGKKLRQIQIFAYVNKDLENGIPSCIKVLTGLKTICLTNCHIKKIENFNKLTFLNRILLHGNKIEKIENLQNLVNLEILQLNNNKIRRIQNLEKLVNLKELWMLRNEIELVENIQCLGKLQVLQLWSNKIKLTKSQIQILNQLTKKGVQIYVQSRTNPYQIKIQVNQQIQQTQ